MKAREISKKICPILSLAYKKPTRCLGLKCAWLLPTTTTEVVNPKPERRGQVALAMMPELRVLPKKDWEYTCGHVYKPDTGVTL